MFARVAPRYDLMNRLMTGGLDLGWRRRAAHAANPVGARCLDLATGTGDLALELCRQGAKSVVGVDYCEPMLREARRKLARASLSFPLPRGGEGEGARDHSHPPVALVQADALALPFPDETFDRVVSGFLLRNVVDLRQCLAETRRLLRPGGTAVALELTRPAGPLAAAATAYLRRVVPLLGRLLSSDAPAYRYLPASIDPFPDADELARLFVEAGFVTATYHRMGLGAVALHIATI
jgi:demethylmenaquinone methyltransferase/2-methoxy-6-polyprenyl-1,4-benzoquinol methylase